MNAWQGHVCRFPPGQRAGVRTTCGQCRRRYERQWVCSRELPDRCYLMWVRVPKEEPAGSVHRGSR